MPSEVVLKSKKEYVGKIVELLKVSGVWVLMSYKGIDVATDLKLRKELREAGITYFVAKNSMLGFAFKELGYDFEEYLSGSSAIAVAEKDPIVISKILTKYSKELGENAQFYVKAGFLDGKVVGAEIISQYGSLPTKEELYSMLLNVIISPIRGFAIVMDLAGKKLSKES